MFDLLLQDATIVSSRGRQVADIAIQDGAIAFVGRARRPARETLNCAGRFVMPGLIDAAAHFDPDATGDLWEKETAAAVTGGVTTVYALPDGAAPVTRAEAARARAARFEGRSWCHYGLWGAATANNHAELAAAAEAGLIAGVVAYLEARGELGAAMEAVQALLARDLLVAVHPGEAADTAPVQALIELARRGGKPVHLLHVSTAEELHALDPVRGAHPVSSSVTPHHLFFSRDNAPEHARCQPAIRPELDRKSLWTALKRGRVELVTSDHHTVEGGMPGSELIFPMMLGAVKHGRISLEQLAALCAEQPAKVLGLENKGRIEKGADADLILFSEGELARVEAATLRSAAGWSPYLDRECAPKPELVLLGGEPVARRGQLVGAAPRGAQVRRRQAAAV